MGETKRIQMSTAQLDGVTAQQEVFLGPPTSVRRGVNAHNIWLSISGEPEDAGANSNGVWVLILKRDSTVATPTFSFGNINGEFFNQMIVACGTYVASNEGPANYTTQIKTSRNLNPGEGLTLIKNLHGISAGKERSLLMMCYGEVEK